MNIEAGGDRAVLRVFATGDQRDAAIDLTAIVGHLGEAHHFEAARELLGIERQAVFAALRTARLVDTRLRREQGLRFPRGEKRRGPALAQHRGPRAITDAPRVALIVVDAG